MKKFKQRAIRIASNPWFLALMVLTITTISIVEIHNLYVTGDQKGSFALASFFTLITIGCLGDILIAWLMDSSDKRVKDKSKVEA